MSSTTSILGWPYPDPGDSPDVPYWIQQLAEAIEADMVDADTRGVPAGGRVRLTSTSSTNANSGTPVAVSGLSFNATLKDGRLYRLKFDGMLISSVAGDRGSVVMQADGVTIKTTQTYPMNTASSGYGAPVERLLTCSSTSGDLTPGAHTFQLALTRVAGTGNINVVASSGTPAQFWLEDAGPIRT